MAGNKGKTPIDDQPSRRARFIVLAGEGATTNELAEKFDVTPNTIYNWKKRPKVKEDLELYCRELILTAARRLGNQVIWAIDELIQLAKNTKNEQVKLSALCKIVDHLEKTLDRNVKMAGDNGIAPNGQPDQTYAELMSECRTILDRHGSFLPEPGTFAQEPIDVDSSPVEPPADDEPDTGPSNGHGGNGKPPGPPSNGKH